MNALQIIEFFDYRYKDAALAFLFIEQNQGKEVVDRLLEEIQSPPVQKHAKHFVNRLRELVEVEETAKL
jgi:hypothetical protein